MTISQLESECRLLVDANTATYSAADLLRRENTAYEEIVGKLIGLDGRWQFDDTNYSDLPIGTTTMVASQQDYSFDVSFLEIIGVSVMNAAGIWMPLRPFDASQDSSLDRSELYKTAGLPIFYDKQGASVFLYPAPSAAACTLTAGLKVYYQRTAKVWSSGDQSTGTAVPGFASPFHVLIAYKAALPFAMAYVPKRVGFIETEIARIEKNLWAFYGRREKDEKKKLTSKRISFK